MPITGSTASAASSGSGSSARIAAVVRPFGQADGGDHADPGADEGADQLAQGAAGEHQGQRQTDGRQAGALGDQDERQEDQEAHPRRAVDHADREQHRKSERAAAAGLGLDRGLLFSRGLRRQSRRQPVDRGASHQPDDSEDRHHRLPRQQHQQQRGHRRHRHFPDVAGEVVGAEHLHRARPGKRAGDQRRGERMLRARSEAADQQRQHQRPEPDAAARDQIADARQRRAERQHQRQADPFGQQRRRNLKARHGAGVAGAQKPQRRVADGEVVPARAAA